jgi:hypothetical protein
VLTDAHHTSHCVHVYHACVLLEQPTLIASYWEVIECARRLLLTGALVFILPGEAGQSTVACVVAVLSMVLFIRVQPFTDNTDTYSYTLGCIVLFMSMLVALLVQGQKADAGTDNERALGVILMCLNVMLVVLVAVQMSMSVRGIKDLRHASMYGLLALNSTSGATSTAAKKKGDSLVHLNNDGLQASTAAAGDDSDGNNVEAGVTDLNVHSTSRLVLESSSDTDSIFERDAHAVAH